MTTNLEALHTEINRSVGNYLIAAIHDTEGETLDDAMLDLQDMFPDIESIMPIDDIKKVWTAEISRRLDILDALTEPDGVEQIVCNALTGLALYQGSVNAITVVKSAYPDDANEQFIKGKMATYDRNWAYWFVKLKQTARMRVATGMLEYARGRYPSATKL